MVRIVQLEYLYFNCSIWRQLNWVFSIFAKGTSYVTSPDFDSINYFVSMNVEFGMEVVIYEPIRSQREMTSLEISEIKKFKQFFMMGLQSIITENTTDQQI